jgi:hypothetical protein
MKTRASIKRDRRFPIWKARAKVAANAKVAKRA